MQLLVLVNVGESARPVEAVGRAVEVHLSIDASADLNKWRTGKEWSTRRNADRIVGIEPALLVLDARNQAIQGIGISQVTKLEMPDLVGERGVVGPDRPRCARLQVGG